MLIYITISVFAVGAFVFYHGIGRMRRIEAVSEDKWQEYARYEKRKWEVLRDEYHDKAGMQLILSGCVMTVVSLFWIWSIFN